MNGLPDSVDRPDLSIVVPLYNEQENIQEVHRRVTSALETLGKSFEIIFVNDGSSDRTPALGSSARKPRSSDSATSCFTGCSERSAISISHSTAEISA